MTSTFPRDPHETDDPNDPTLPRLDIIPSFYDSAYPQRRPQGTNYVFDYTRDSNAITTYRNYFEIYYAGPSLGLCEREPDITQCRRSPHINTIQFYCTVGLKGHALMCWDIEPVLGVAWQTYIMRWPFTYDAYRNLLGLIYTVFRFTIRIMVQGPEIHDVNTLLIADEGVLCRCSVHCYGN